MAKQQQQQLNSKLKQCELECRQAKLTHNAELDQLKQQQQTELQSQLRERDAQHAAKTSALTKELKNGALDTEQD